MGELVTEAEFAGRLATIAATQEHTASALELLTAEMRSAREESQEQRVAVNEALGRISTEVETTKIKLGNHLENTDQRIEMIWRVLKWLAGLIVTGGTVAGGARIAEGFW